MKCEKSFVEGKSFLVEEKRKTPDRKSTRGFFKTNVTS